ncbi:MAG TPA: murein biosynthesis integral membrane protein MurJ [Longimicrobium sp.]|nr:murein biosynthesis integral membrane protein MurJ [Longimicrobium sp.]
MSNPADPDRTLPYPESPAQPVPPEPDDPEAKSVAEEPARAAPSSARSSALVAAGILLSRIAGLVRARVFAGFFGTSPFADVFNAGMRMPNVLQNMLGEGTLSASFIPVYSELLHEGKKEEAGRVAGAIFALLFAVAGALALIGVALAPILVPVFVPGFDEQRRELTIEITRILFPMTAILVLSAWSLGILNSHRQFFLPYVAPVFWNGAMIATLLMFGRGMALDRLVVAMAWGALVGGFLQFAVQLPGVLRLERSLKLSWGTRLQGVRDAVRNAGPAVMGRGVVQISGYVDVVLASFLATGAVATLQYAQMLYLLPISLFGMSVAAAELPELSRQRGGAGGDEILRQRASGGLERIAFYVIPSFVAFVALGDMVVGGLYQSGEFGRGDTLVVTATLAAFAVGLLATTASRMLSSTFFALRDTRTPARYAMLRVVLSIVLAIVLMLQFEGITLGKLDVTIPGGLFSDLRLGGQPLGPVGLALGGGIAAWVEWALLKRALHRRIGKVGGRVPHLVRMFAAAAAGAAAAWGVRLLLPDDLMPLVAAVFVLGTYGVVYFAMAGFFGLEQSDAIFRRVKGLLRRG